MEIKYDIKFKKTEKHWDSRYGRALEGGPDGSVQADCRSLKNFVGGQ